MPNRDNTIDIDRWPVDQAEPARSVDVAFGIKPSSTKPPFTPIPRAQSAATASRLTHAGHQSSASSHDSVVDRNRQLFRFLR